MASNSPSSAWRADSGSSPPAAASQPPVSQTETAKGVGTVTTDQIKGQVVEVEGNNLLVKLTSGELRTFKVAA